MKCNDAPDEPNAVSMSNFRQLKVNIGAGVSTYLISDIQAVSWLPASLTLHD
jgi:hypothetical protein